VEADSKEIAIPEDVKKRILELVEKKRLADSMIENLIYGLSSGLGLKGSYGFDINKMVLVKWDTDKQVPTEH